MGTAIVPLGFLLSVAVNEVSREVVSVFSKCN